MRLNITTLRCNHISLLSGKSRITNEFRFWSTQKLKEYIVKGFALNDERFKSGSYMSYFNELQERIKEIG